MNSYPAAEDRNSTIWRLLGQAIRGVEVDYTAIPLSKAIFLLAVPMILELVLESVFAIVDIYFVGKLGPSAVAAVGITETYLFLLYSVAMGLGVAVTAVVARRVGEKDSHLAGLSAWQSILIACLASIPFALAGLFFSQDLMRIMGGDEWVVSEGYRYAAWMLGGNVVIMLLFVINAVFRGAGDAVLSMHVLWIANGLNIVLDPILIFGWGPIPAFGLEGAAMATNIGRGIGVCVQIFYLFRGGKNLKFSTSALRLHLRTMMQIMSTSLGGILQMIIAMTSWIFIMRILADIGSEAVAGSTIALRIMMFTMMPAWGLSNAAATLVGQNLGAGHPDRAASSIWRIGFINMGFMILTAIVFYFYNQDLVALFSEDARVIEIGSCWLYMICFSYFIYGWWMVAVQAFNGSGDTRTPTLINLVFFWIIQIPLAYLLALHWGYGYQGVFLAMICTEAAVGLFTLWLFSRGGWKSNEV